MTQRIVSVTRMFVLLCVGVQSHACKLDNLTDVSDPIEGGVITVDAIESPEGARWVYRGSIMRFTQVFANSAAAVARFTDEVSLSPSVTQSQLDDRVGRDGNEPVPYVNVSTLLSSAQSAKIQIEQALQLVDAYYDASGNVMRAHLYGLLGMVHLILADNFCSGIALSESKWGGEFTPGEGYTTDSLYQRAMDLFDKGLALDFDSAEVKTLLLVGKARALTSLGRWREAADVASSVSDGDSLWMTFLPLQPQGSVSGVYYPSLVSYSSAGVGIDTLNFLVRNNKGTNGLVWVASDPDLQDMRVAIRTFGGDYMVPFKPSFFFSNRSVQIAGSVEARLIEAEYLLRSERIPEFLEKINTVRRMFRTAGGIPLADTTDPGTLEGRIDLLFRERAYTFYVTGRRLGDLRRLVRQYGRTPQDVFPVGISEGKQFYTYGENYVFAPESPDRGAETTNNPRYGHCESYAP